MGQGRPAVAAQWMARGEHEIPATDGWLTRREAARAGELRFTKRRTEFLLRRWVCKQAVAAVAGLSSDLPTLARIEVANHPGGAPYVHVDREPVGLDVSITDRAGWALCMVGENLSRVGCDLEIVEPRSAAFVADFLTPAEQAFVASRPGTERDVAANLVWSAKESALKVLRTGLRRDTRSVEVSFGPSEPAGGPAPHGWARLEVRAAEGRVFPGWWRRDGVFLLTLASEDPLGVPEALAGSADLTSAEPTHSWLQRPLSS